MDLVQSCKDKLAHFRIKELKDVLTQLGLSKQGKKQDLVERIIAVVEDESVSRMWAKKNAVGKEEVAKLVDDTYRKIQGPGATDLASKDQSLPESSNAKVKEEVDSYKKIRCPCGITLETEPIVQCDDPKCGIWQHIACIVIPEKPTDSLPKIPDPFYCEICRLSRADPFWVSLAHPLFPVKLTASNVPTDGTNPLQSIERTFQLTRADKDLLSKHDYDVQAWCMLLNDKVSYRMQWPQYSDLQVNGVPVRAINRPGSQLLGANGRDDGPVITPCTKDGINKITLTGCDARIFCLGVRIVKRRTVQQILNLIPKELDGEPFADAVARVCRCVGGGAPADTADSDSDIEVVADSFGVNLRCPMSGSRMKTAGRFKPCVHMGCFDLETFVELNQRSRKWQCPICLKNYSLENVIIDPYFNRITSMMRHCGEDVTEIEVKPDGSWRPKGGTVGGELGQWHFPDGSLYVLKDETKPKVELPIQIKQEGVSEGHTSLKLGIKKNRNGLWEVSKPEDNILYSGNGLQDKFRNNGPSFVPMSSSGTASARDGDDASVNQDAGGNFDFSANNGIELDSTSLMDTMYGFPEQNQSAPAGADAVVIVLSDSEDENVMASSGTVFRDNHVDSSGATYPVHHGISESYPEDPNTGTGGNSCLGLFNTQDDEFGPLWPLPHGPQTAPGFQLFSSDADVANALVDVQHTPMNCQPSINGYTLAPDTTVAAPALIPDASFGVSNSDLNGGLVDNPMAFHGDDPSLQIFLPTRPSNATDQSDLRGQTDISNSIRSEDWISLRLGDGGGHAVSGATNKRNSRQQETSKDGAMNSLADTASLLLGINDGRLEKTSQQMSDSPFSFPRQKRSVRPRLYLSIDSDSE